MGGYFANFIVYTTAMVGIIFLAVFVYKKFSYTNVSKSKFLNKGSAHIPIVPLAIT